MTFAERPAFSTAAFAASAVRPTTDGTTYGVATHSTTSSPDLNSEPSAGDTSTTVPLAASEFTDWMRMFVAPSSRRAFWASSCARPVTCGTVRARATVRVACVVSERLPGSGVHAVTVPMASSAGWRETSTVKPAASSLEVAVASSRPTTSSTVLPPQSSWS